MTITLSARSMDRLSGAHPDLVRVIRRAAAISNIDFTVLEVLRTLERQKKLVAQGAQLRPFSTEILTACYNAANQVYAETSAKNADFKKAIDAMQAYRSDQYLWWQVAEYTNDSFMIRSRTRG